MTAAKFAGDSGERREGGGGRGGGRINDRGCWRTFAVPEYSDRITVYAAARGIRIRRLCVVEAGILAEFVSFQSGEGGEKGT